MTLDLSRSSVDFLLGLDAKPLRQIIRKILMLLTDPRPNDAQLLKGYDKMWRTDVGEFRIIYRFDDLKIYTVLIGRRNDDDVYPRLDRIIH